MATECIAHSFKDTFYNNSESINFADFLIDLNKEAVTREDVNPHAKGADGKQSLYTFADGSQLYITLDISNNIVIRSRSLSEIERRSAGRDSIVEPSTN